MATNPNPFTIETVRARLAEIAQAEPKSDDDNYKRQAADRMLGTLSDVTFRLYRDAARSRERARKALDEDDEVLVDICNEAFSYCNNRLAALCALRAPYEQVGTLYSWDVLNDVVKNR